MSKPALALALSAAGALALSSPAAAITSSSADYSNTRSSLDNGGVRMTFSSLAPNTTNYRMDSVVGGITVSSATNATGSTPYSTRDGLMGIDFYPGRISAIAATATGVDGDLILQFTAPGNDGSFNPNSGVGGISTETSKVKTYVIKYSSIPSQSPALSEANFAAADTPPFTPSNLVQAGAFQVETFTGLTGGVTYYFAVKGVEADGLLGPLSAGATAQTTAGDCATTVSVGKSGAFANNTIQSAVNAVPHPLTNYTCVIIQDSATYPEQVTVQGSAVNGSSLTIRPNPYTGAAPVIAPSGVTAAFIVAQSSVNLVGLDIVPGGPVSYGVQISSPNVNVSSVSIIDPGSTITKAGIAASSATTVSYSSVTAGGVTGGVGASALWLTGSGATVLRTTATAGVAARYALWLNGASGSTITNLFAANSVGPAAALDGGASQNTLTSSTFTASSPLYAVYVGNASTNTISASSVTNTAAGSGAYLDAGASYNSLISDVLVGGSGAGADALYIHGSHNSITSVSASGGAAGSGAYLDTGAAYNALSQSTFTGNSSLYAFYIGTASSNTLTASVVANPAGFGAYLDAGSSYDTLSQDSLASSAVGSDALYVDGSHHTITAVNAGASGGTGAYLDSAAAFNTLSQSTFTSAAVGYYAVKFAGAVSNTVSASVVSNPAGVAAFLGSGAAHNTISLSSVTSDAVGVSALQLAGVSSNTVSGSFVSNPLGIGADLDVGAISNTLVSSTFTSGAAGYEALYVADANNMITGSYVSNPAGNGAFIDSGARNTAVTGGAFTSNAAGHAAIVINGALNTSVNGSIAQGSTGVFVTNGAAGTVISGGALTATSNTGYALELQGAAGLTLTGSAVTAPSAGAAVYMAGGNSATTILSTNTISGGEYGVFIGTQSPGAQVWITSNTILPAVATGNNTYGLFLDGLTTGATIQNNGIYYRTAGFNIGSTAYGLSVQTSAGVVIDHNRISNPGMVTGGGFTAAAFNGASATFKFNDVNAAGAGLTSAYLLTAAALSRLTVKDNIFVSYVTVLASSATIAVDASSLAGLSSNYNDFFSSNSQATALLGGQSYVLPPAWNAATGQDLYSISADPLWVDTSAGVEDFHPQSQTGRCPIAGAYGVPCGAPYVTTDTQTSPTIDSGDPAEALGGALGTEPTPNGGTVNQGSTGQTADASMSIPSLCFTTRKVSATHGPYVTIQSAVNTLPASLTGEACVVIEDGATYPEQVTVRNFTMNGSSITIFADPSTGLTPTVSPPAGKTAAFVIADSSVVLYGIDIVATNAVPYGVFASSAYVTVSTISVSGSITTAGVSVSSSSIVSEFNITVGAADGIDLAGAANTTVTSGVTTVAGASAAGLRLNGATSNAVSSLTASNSLGDAVVLTGHSNNNTISNSGLSSQASAFAGLHVSQSSANSFTQSTAQNTAGYGAWLDSGATNNTLSSDTLDGSAAGAALYLSGASNNTVTQDSISNPGGPGAILDSASGLNSISLSTISASGVALTIAGGTDTVTQSLISGSTAAAVAGSAGSSITSSILVAGATGDALSVTGSSGFTLSSSTLSGGARAGGVHIGSGNWGPISVYSNQISAVQAGLLISGASAGSRIMVSSNTILPALSASFNTYGVLVNGLTSGASIVGNNVYYRTPLNIGGQTAYAFSVQSSSGVVIDHNRINEPDMVSGGSYEALAFSAAINSTVTYNDVFSSASASLTNFYLVQAVNSSVSLVVRNNVFASSVTVTGSSATVAVDLASQSGFYANYNDYFSSTTLSFTWGASILPLASWQLISAQDAGSFALNPMWESTGAGAEDFHPMSPVGRWNPSLLAFVVDTAYSPTIDSADPADAYNYEPLPNGGQANQGSYGNTPEASKSALPPSNISLAGVWLSSAAVHYGLVGAAAYEVDASTDPTFASSVSVGSVGATTLAVQGLFANTTYYLRAGALYGPIFVYSRNVLSTSTWSNIVSATAVTQVSSANVAVNWVPLPAAPPAVSSASAEGYLVQIGTAADFTGTLFSSRTANVTTGVLVVGGLTTGDTYYFRVGSLNWDGVANYAPSVSFVHVLRPPEEPFGFVVSTTAAGIELGWMPVVRFADQGTFAAASAPTSNELAGYIVFRASEPVTAQWTPMVTLSTAATTWTDPTGGTTSYYFVESFNNSGISAPSAVLASGDPYAYLVAPDQISYLQILSADLGLMQFTSPSSVRPADANSLYLVEVQSRPQDIGSLNGRVVQSISWNAYLNGTTQSPTFMAAHPGTLHLHYATAANGNVAAATVRPGSVAPTPSNMSVYFYNGARWVQLYGTLDATSRTELLTTPYFGTYQLRTVERTGGFAFNQAGVSNRFITPNGDRKNDNVVFTFDNPQDSSITGKIYDLHGRVVAASLPPGPTAPAVGQGSLVWDGTAGGRPVPGGVYIYQISGEGQTFTGTVVVIR